MAATATSSELSIASPTERRTAKRAAMEGVRKGARAAATACVVTAIPTLLGARMMPGRARHFFNYTVQASIISASTMAAYFIVADKATLASARAASYERILKEREAAAVSTKLKA